MMVGDGDEDDTGGAHGHDEEADGHDDDVNGEDGDSNDDDDESDMNDNIDSKIILTRR